MGVLVACHLVFAVAAPLAVRRWGRRAFFGLAVPPLATFVWALTQTGAARSQTPPTERLSWVPSLGLELSFRLDPLSWLLVLVVAGVGALVLLYCAAYFEDAEPGLGRFAGVLTAFAGAMLGLVTTDDLLVLYVFWELTTVLSYLLIGHRPESRSSRSAATQALVVTTLGGLAMLVGIVLLGHLAGTYRLSAVIATAPALPSTPVLTTAVALILVGALSKSALVPFHFWLPAAMAAPTPVSAYLHAAAMVKAGIYLVARFAPAFADNPAWRPMVFVLGGTTMVLGAYRSLRQHDLKLLLAYGTVSQLGFLVVLVGTGLPDAALAGAAMLLAHALFKSSLFLVVGAIDHVAGTRDLRELSGLRRSTPGLALAGLLAACSMAGVPIFFGFVAKEAAFTAYLDAEQAWAPWVLGVLVAGSMLTFAYSARFVIGAFGTKADLGPTQVHAPGPLLTGVPLLLAAIGLLIAPFSGALDPLFASYAAQVGEPNGHLAVWHGFNAALGLSALTWVVGTLVVLAAARVERWQAILPSPVGADAVYRRVMRGVDRAALEVTGGVQRGSPPLTLGTILMVFVLLPGGAGVLALRSGAGDVRWADSGAQVIVAVVVAVAAIAATRARRRLRAVFLVGVTGYGSAVIFLLFGAPDVALTQVLVETVSLIVFILVLRRLPGRFDEDVSRRVRLTRAGLGAAVGGVATLLAIVVPQVRTAAPASTGMSERAVSYGGGQNIVNVILVDIRAWDTMGELSVVLAAATGIASLVFLEQNNMSRADAKLRHSRDRRRRVLRGSAHEVPRAWLPGAAGLPDHRTSVMFEVVTRFIFQAIIVWSIFLLFSGHNAPGGGFAAGLVAGLGLTVRYLAGGRDELRSALPVSPGALVGVGLFLSAGTGLASMAFGGSVLQTWIFDVSLPLVGTVHVVTSTVFDVGVYLVVLGLMLDILRALGAGLDAQIERARADAGIDAGVDGRTETGVDPATDPTPGPTTDADTAEATR